MHSANTDSRAAPNPTAADERLRRTPLWKYVKVIQKNSTTRGNARSEHLLFLVEFDHLLRYVGLLET